MRNLMNKIKTRKSKHRIIILISALIALALIIFIFAANPTLKGKVVQENKDQNQINAPSKQVIITNYNLIPFLSNQAIINDVPKTTDVMFYVGTEPFHITGSKITRESSSDSDITVTIPYKYLSSLSSKGLCATIREVFKNRDYKVQVNITKAKAVWKYRSLYKYMDCFK